LDISLAALKWKPQDSGADSGAEKAPLLGFALAGRDPMDRLRAAMRAAARDTRGDVGATTAAEEAGAFLSAALLKRSKESTASSSMATAAATTGAYATSEESRDEVFAMPPDLIVRSGILGSRAAAAAVAANSRNNLSEAERGVKALRSILEAEIARGQALISMVADDGGADETRLRLAIVLALFHGRRDRSALREASIAARNAPSSAAAAFLHARCLFRCADRTEALDELKRVATGAASGDLGSPDARWAQSGATRMLRAVKQAETKRVRAVDA